ncbi:MAG: DUF748 domain-containing protein [Opitutaceae bacterium]|nr:DUF748 domain-containing protein [Opitutaceae bacterium]
MSRPPASASGKPPSIQELRAARGSVPSFARRFRRSLIVAGVVAALVLFGFFGLPPIVKAQAIKQLSARLGREVQIEKIRINPLVLSATIEGLSIAEADAKQGAFTGWRRFYANFDSWSVFAGEIRFQEIALDGFHARVALNDKGEFNFADILAKVTADSAAPAEAENAGPKEAGKPLALAIRALDVTDARVTFDDGSRKRPFSTVAGPLTFSLRDFHTVGDPNAPYRFEAVTAAGERLAWQGTVSADPVKSQGELTLANIDLARLSPYYHELVAGELRSAFVDLSGRYSFELKEGIPALTLADGAFTLRDVRLGAPGVEEDAFALRRLAVTGIAADATALSASVGKVAIEGVRVNAVRDAQGIDLVRLVTPLPTATPAPAGAATSPASTSPAPALPKVTLGEFALSDVQVRVVDLTTPRRAEHRIEDITLSLRDLDSAELAKAVPLAFELKLPEGGRVALGGEVAAQPLAAQLDVTLERVPFANASPYVEPFINIRLAGGVIRAQGRATLRDGVAGYAGDFGIGEFRTVDGKLAEDFVKWTDFSLTRIRATSAPLAFHADEIRFVEPSAAVRVEADGTLSIAQAASPAGAAGTGDSAPVVATPATPGSGASAPMPVVSIGAFAFERAAFRFEDRSIKPAARGALTDFTGSIKGLSSEALGRADVDLRGKVDGVAPVAITGKLNPLGTPAFVDLKVSFQDIDLQPGAGPYVGKFVGRTLARGNLDVAVTAKLADRKVDAANVVTLDQFYLGEKTNSPDATKLPVGLALALLRDTQGKIVIDIPVKGSLDDPEFKIGRVVVRVLVNILTKAATSPFSLLGAAFGGGGDELGWQDFAAGSAGIDPAGIQKLGTVAKALNARPALSLDIVGAHDPVRDAEVLRRAQLDKQVRSLAWETRRLVDVNTPPMEQLEITPELRAGMVARLYAEAFPLAPGEIAPRVVVDENAPSIPLVPAGGAVVSPFDPTPASSPAAPRRQVGRLPKYGAPSVATVSAPAPRVVSPDASAPASAPTSASAPESAPAAADGQTVVPTISLADMEARLTQRIEIPATELQALAEGRAQAIRAWLIETGKVPAERIFLAPTADTGLRVNLNLK